MAKTPENSPKIPEKRLQNPEIEQKKLHLKEDTEKTKQFVIDTIIKITNDFIASGKAFTTDIKELERDYQEPFNNLMVEFKNHPHLKKYFENTPKSQFKSRLKELMLSWGYYFDVHITPLLNKKKERAFLFDICCCPILAKKKHGINKYFPDNTILSQCPPIDVLFLDEDLTDSLYRTTRVGNAYIRPYGMSEPTDNRVIIFAGLIKKEMKANNASPEAIKEKQGQILANESGHLLFYNFFKEEIAQISDFRDYKLGYEGRMYTLAQFDDALSVVTELSVLDNDDFIETVDHYVKNLDIRVESYEFNKVYFAYVFDKLAKKYNFRTGKEGKDDFKNADLLTQNFFRDEFVKMAHDGLFSLMLSIKQQFTGLINRSRVNPSTP